MSEFRRLMRLAPSGAVKEKRLAALREGAGPEAAPDLDRAVADAQERGSLDLVEVETGRPAPAGWAEAWRRARESVDPQVPLTVSSLRTWHRALTGSDAFRDRELPPRGDGPPAAPVAFIESRLEILQQWMQMDSGRELKPAQQGALVLARVVEITPFEDANGLVARMAASHMIVRAEGRPPLLNAGDAARLLGTLSAAFRLDTEPLTALLEEASERTLDVMIATLERRRGAPG